MSNQYLNGIFRKRAKYLSIGIAISIVVAFGLLEPMQVWTQSAEKEKSSGPEAIADVGAQFVKVWSLAGCMNVANGESGLWDDSPGAGTSRESAFLWFVTDSTDNENCTYSAPGESVSTTSFPQLQVRAAVNDGAILKVTLKSGSTNCVGGTTIGSISFLGIQNNGAFIIKQINLPSGKSVSEVCITLDDDPDSNFSSTDRRTSALIDYIIIWRSSTGATNWHETFARAG